MGRAPCCAKVGLHRGPWTPTEDSLLTTYIQTHGEGQWRSLPKNAGLLRCGKSCRLRWMNYLRPDIKRGDISPDEDDLIIRLHALLGNRWSLIAGRLPGRTDNEIKNYWNTHLSKQLRSQGTDPNTHKKLSDLDRALLKPRPKPKPKKQKMMIKGTPEKQVVHQPKPTRVTSLQLVSASLKRISSNASFESSLTTVSPSTSNVVPPCWPPYDLCAAAPTYDIGGDQEDDDVAPAASELDKLYQEYFQLIKADGGHHHGLGLDLDLDLGADVDHARELDSFAESLLV